MLRNTAKLLGVLLAILAAVALWTARTYTPKIPGENAIAEERRVQISGTEQYVLIRGHDRSNPVLLFLHGGPGSSAMAFNKIYNADLERDFIFVDWDQPGTGYSYSAIKDPSDLTLDRLSRDLDQLVDLLRDEFSQDKIFIAGHSWGSMLGLDYVSRHPEKVAAYIGIGQMADTLASEILVYDWAMQQAVQNSDQKSIDVLNKIGTPPYENVEEMMTHRGVINLYGGSWKEGMSDLKYARIATKASEFAWPGLIDTVRGLDLSLLALFDEFSALNAAESYPVIEVPVYFFLGRGDRVVAPEPAISYLDKLQAPHKQVIWFEDSAHNLNWENPEKFMQEIRRVANKHSL